MLSDMNKIVTIIGGTGFLGSAIAHELAQEGYRIQLVSRYADRANISKLSGQPGQVVFVRGNILDVNVMKEIIDGSYAVINLVGILHETSSQTFDALHHRAAANMAKLAKELAIEKYIHLSALGVNKAADSYYAQSKYRGERAVKKILPNAAIFRPSVIYGRGDHFTNRFARLMKLIPFLPLAGCETLFQPVYAGDVAKAAATCLRHNKNSTLKPVGIFELGGSEQLTLCDILSHIRRWKHLRCPIIPLPLALAKIQGFVLQQIPGKPMTLDQVRLLQYDNVVEGKKKGFKELGIQPCAFSEMAPVVMD